MQNNALIQFLVETFRRFTAKSPKFFQIWQIISGALVLVTGLPALLSMIDVHLPELWNDHLNTIISWCSRGVLLMSLLTTQSKVAAVNTEGEILKKTNDDKLPFTDSQEKKAFNKSDVIVPLVDTVGTT